MSRSRRVLIVDDNPDAVESLRLLLEIEGHRVVTAREGPSALERVLEYAPEVALLDIGLPGMDGYELARRIRDLPQGRGMLLVAVSGYGRKEDVEKARECGFDLHLLKPVEVTRLRTIIGSEGHWPSSGPESGGALS